MGLAVSLLGSRALEAGFNDIISCHEDIKDEEKSEPRGHWSSQPERRQPAEAQLRWSGKTVGGAQPCKKLGEAWLKAFMGSATQRKGEGPQGCGRRQGRDAPTPDPNNGSGYPDWSRRQDWD